jgi:acyl-CoA reductase-like NAD-dependent aldehyde dehydrogenase
MPKGALNLDLSSTFDGIFDLKGDIKEFKIYIGGRWRLSEENDVFDIRTPIDGGLIARSQKATPGDVSLAASAAKKAAKEMMGLRDLPAIERIEIFNCAAGMLEDHKDEFAVPCSWRPERRTGMLSES